MNGATTRLILVGALIAAVGCPRDKDKDGNLIRRPVLDWAQSSYDAPVNTSFEAILLQEVDPVAVLVMDPTVALPIAESSADTNDFVVKSNDDGMTPLQFACLREGKTEVVAFVNEPPTKYEMHQLAAVPTDEGAAQFLIEVQADVHTTMTINCRLEDTTTTVTEPTGPTLIEVTDDVSISCDSCTIDDQGDPVLPLPEDPEGCPYANVATLTIDDATPDDPARAILDATSGIGLSAYSAALSQPLEVNVEWNCDASTADGNIAIDFEAVDQSGYPTHLASVDIATLPQ